MERRYELRLEQMLAQAEVSPELIRGLLDRLEAFVEPLATSLEQPERPRHAVEYMTGLLSKLPRKSGEAIAYLHDHHRQGLQNFVGQVPWDDRPLLDTLARQVGQEIGEPDAVIVFDPSGFAKKGTKSVGVIRQWCGRLGKLENCQVGVYMAYVSRKEHALVDTRLYLPKEWATDRPRRKEAGVPRSVKFRTRHQLALEMLAGCGKALPHTWVAGDDEMGRPSSFRRELRDRGERYLLGVPSNMLVRDLDVPPPAYSGRRAVSQEPILTSGSLAGRSAGGRLDPDRGAGRREGAAGRRGGQASRASEDRDRGHGAGRAALRGSRGPGRWQVQARLLSIKCRSRGAIGGAGEGIAGGAPGRGMLPAGQERGGTGRLPGEELARVAPSSDIVAAGRVVPESGDAAGEKSGPRG